MDHRQPPLREPSTPLRPIRPPYAARTAVSALAPVDRELLHQITGGDQQFECELAEAFEVSGTLAWQEIRSAIELGGPVALARAAHKLTGASANIHAMALYSSGAVLESAAHQPDLSRPQSRVAGLVQEFGRVNTFLKLSKTGTRAQTATG